ncbi:hypothetical protein D6833_13065 [Candidatus Parcubacteria bacterium]|nr:MAG: hypothetical protein D6833_13065 [Candidatus Parcubacteria bacterium]
MVNFLKRKDQTPSDEQARQHQYVTTVAPDVVEVGYDHLVFSQSVLYPLSVRGTGAPGMPGRPWQKLSAQILNEVNAPYVYSVALRRESPDTLRRSLRSRRTLFEGLMLAAAQKTGRRPSQAESFLDQAMDNAESALQLGEPAYHASWMLGVYAGKAQMERGESARHALEARLRAMGLLPQRLYYIAQRALDHLQPGGVLFPGIDEPTLMLYEAVPLLPPPTRRVMPAPDAVWIGFHAREGRDVYFSFKQGFDPTAPPPPHAITLIMGEMGAGKTSLMRSIMLQRLLQGRTWDAMPENTAK